MRGKIARRLLRLSLFFLPVRFGPAEFRPVLRRRLLRIRALLRLARLTKIDDFGHTYFGPVMFSGRTIASNSASVT